MDEHTLNDLLECSVCLDRLDTSSKVLPCQHTFCRKCLEVIVSSRQELRCPECRVLVEIKIDDLPPNVLLMRILEGMKNAAAAKTQHEAARAKHDNNKFDESQKLNEEQQQQMKLKQQQKQFLQYQQQQQFKHKQLQQAQQPQQQQAGPQQHTQSGSNNTNNVILTQQQQQQQYQQQRRCLVPHAYALYDFESNEPSDLNFKKGDLVLLKRKIDVNWYVGQLNGKEGTFPVNYVQVIVALPTPQCIALYDFKMGPNEEEGCLTFKKGTLIHVLRRVDHNWAEGRIGATIGIFPIAFVELNVLAKQLLDSFVALAPPVATNAAAVLPSAHTPATTTATNTSSSQQLPTTASPQQTNSAQPRNLPPIPVPLVAANAVNPCDSNTSSSSSSHATSPNSVNTSSSNSTSNSLPSSPNQSLPTTPQHLSGVVSSGSSSVRYRDKREKRHSLNALLSAGFGVGTAPALSILQSNRHSAEILSVPSELNAVTTNSNAGQQDVRQRNGSSMHSNVNMPNSTSSSSAVAAPQTTIAREQQQQQPTQIAPNSAHSRVNVLKTGAQPNVPPTLPWGYLALYPYKPCKNDELELKKGCVYIVTERCLDGWFKGKNWQDISGVFPGNYVTPLRNRDQQQLMHQWKYVPLQSAPTATTQSPTTAAMSTTNSNNQNHLENINTRLANAGLLPHQPPDLPPRQLVNNSNAAQTAASVWTKPLGQTVEAFFNRSNAKAAQETSVKEHAKEKDAKSKDGNTSSSSAAVSLMKRLAHIKSRSKSPSNSSTCNSPAQQQTQNVAANYSMDNPTFEDAAHLTPMQHTQMHPVHVRSGSCPSQLLQSLPIDLSTSQINENLHIQTPSAQQQQQQVQQQVSPQVNYGSQRIKGNKERPPLQSSTRQSIDSAFRGMFNNITPPTPQQQQHAVTANMLLTKCAQQQQQQQQMQTNYNSANMINHRKSQSLDANTLITSLSATTTATTAAPTTTAVPCNITAAAIVASATTKSTQNARESRFRCVVPYPPNSDIELELHVGDIIYVQRKQKNGWYKGTHARTNKTGLFPASFVEPDI